MTLPKTKYNRNVKPYWTHTVKSAHREQRDARKRWSLEGRPRGMCFQSFAEYKRAKRKFQLAQKSAIESVENEFLNELNPTAECDNRLFWSLIKSRNGKKRPTCTQIQTDNGYSRDPHTISERFTC